MGKRIARVVKKPHVQQMGWIKSSLLTAGGGVVVAVAVVGIIWPTQLQQAASIGEVKEKAANIEKKLDEMSAKLNSIDQNMGLVRQRLSSMDSDPTRLIAAAGVLATAKYGIVSIGADAKLYLFPKTEDLRLSLENAGMKAEAVAPGIFAYPAPKGWNEMILPTNRPE